jgi:hypothetical protein
MNVSSSIRSFHRVGLIRSYTASEYQIEFGRRYLELVFAQLFNARPSEGQWCASGANDFKRSIAAGSGHPGSMYLADSSARHLLDEAAWHCARLLNTLYETAPFDLSRDTPSLVPVSDDRYWLMAAFATMRPGYFLWRLGTPCCEPFWTWCGLISSPGVWDVPTSRRQRGLPLAAIVEHWPTTLETWRNLLCAADPLAIRIHEAIVSFNTGSSSSNPVDRVQAHWRVFEIIVRKEKQKSQGPLLPLYFIHKSFESMSGPEKRTFVGDRVEMLRRQFKGWIDFRNKAIDHRVIVRPDSAVLHHWAATGETLAREVLSAAIVGWHQGARSEDELYRKLRAAYDRRRVPLR